MGLPFVWEVNDADYMDHDVIALISYACRDNARLTNGSRLTTELAAQISKISGKKIIFGTFSKNLWSEAELLEKVKMLEGLSRRHVGPVSSSTDEAQAILKEVAPGQKILVIAEGSHSRRDRLVWREIAKGHQVRFRSASSWKCADIRNPMLMQKFYLVWRIANIATTPVYKCKPILRLLIKWNFSQPA
jgi:hypothetical protein